MPEDPNVSYTQWTETIHDIIAAIRILAAQLGPAGGTFGVGLLLGSGDAGGSGNATDELLDAAELRLTGATPAEAH